MSIFGVLLFFLILIFVVLPVAFLSRLFGGLFGMFRRHSDDGYGFFRGTRQSSPRPDRKKKKKVFDRNDGEYVEFEEIIDERSSTRTSADSSTYETEEQVSDAEWTEIK